MHTFNKRTLALAVCLSALAGSVDAIGFLQLGGFFISFMSGNSTQLAVGIVHGDIYRIAVLGVILVFFVIGAILGTLVGHFAKAARHAVAVLSFVTLLLALAALCYGMGMALPAIVLMTLAMGAENAVAQRAGDIVVGLTYMTGTLVKMGQRIANALLGGDKYAWVPYLLLWLGLITGGMIGAILFHMMGLYSLWIATLWAAILTIAARLTKAFTPAHAQ